MSPLNSTLGSARSCVRRWPRTATAGAPACKAALSGASSVAGTSCRAGSKAISCRAVRPLAAGAPLVSLDELHATACQGCPSCGGQLTVRGPRTRTAEDRLIRGRKIGASREASQDLRVPRSAVALSMALRSRAAPGCKVAKAPALRPRSHRRYASGAQ